MLKKPVTFIFLLVLTLWCSSQSTQQVFIDGKNNLSQENYSSAITQFAGLANDPTFGAYATFYLGLSYYQSGANQNALDAWRQLLIKYPDFDQQDEINFWMVSVFFQQKDFNKAVEYAQRIEKKSSKMSLYISGFEETDFKEMRGLHQKYPKDYELAKVLVKVGLEEELTKKDAFFLRGVQQLHDIQISSFGEFPVVKKDAYSVAVMLPFLFDDLSNPERILRNELVMDLYQGMMLASEILSGNGIELALYPFDTQRDSLQTEVLLRNSNMKKMDLIVGPLFTKPAEIVNTFSRENSLPTLNPISSNSMMMASNPYALLWKPTYETMARMTAEYMAATRLKYEANIYFEDTPTESLFAQVYKNRIEELGFVVTDFQPIDSRTAREVLAQFTDQEELVLNITKSQFEKELEEGRLIRSREVFDASGNLIVNSDGQPRLEYYELVFTADTDSLDHIVALTRSNLLANNFVGAVESISDTVRLVGLGDWLNFSMLDYRQLERRQVNLIDPDFLNRKSDFFMDIEAKFEQKFKKKPNQFNLSGFESIWWAGNMMHRFGKYFQNGLHDNPDFPCLYYGHEFVFGEVGNQAVPIVRFKDDELKAVNLIQEIEEENEGIIEGDE